MPFAMPVAPVAGPVGLGLGYAPQPGSSQGALGPTSSSYLFGPGASGEFMSMLGLAAGQQGGQQGGGLAPAAAQDAMRSTIRANPNVDPGLLASLLENTQLGRGGLGPAGGQPASMPAPLMFTQPMMPTPTAGAAPGSMGPPPAVLPNPALAALQEHDPMKRNRSSGLTNMMVVPDGKAQRTRSGQQPYGPMGMQQQQQQHLHAAAPPPPPAPEPEITPEVKSHTARSLLRMLRAGTGVRTKNDISIVEAESIVRKLGGEFAPVEVLKTKKRNAGREALSVLLTMYLQRPISIAEAARCFHNPTNRGLEPTDRLWELLGDKCWPPFPEDKPAKPPSPHPAAVASARGAAQRAQQAKAAAQSRQAQARMGYHQAGRGQHVAAPVVQQQQQQQQPRTMVTGNDSSSPFAAVVSAGPGSFRPAQQGGMTAQQAQQVYNSMVGKLPPNPIPNFSGMAPSSVGMPAMVPLPQSGVTYQMNFAGALGQGQGLPGGQGQPVGQGQPAGQGPALGQGHQGHGAPAHPGYAASNLGNAGADNSWSQGPFSAYAESTGRVPEHRGIRNIPVQTPGGAHAAGPSQAPSLDVSLSGLLTGGTLQQLSAAVDKLHQAPAPSSQAPPASAAGPQASASPTMSGLFNELLAESDLSRDATLSGILGTTSLTAASDPTMQQLAAAAKNSKSASNGSMAAPASLSSELDFGEWPELRS